MTSIKTHRFFRVSPGESHGLTPPGNRGILCVQGQSRQLFHPSDRPKRSTKTPTEHQVFGTDHLTIAMANGPFIYRTDTDVYIYNYINIYMNK
jgi:hypothetical protein